MRRHINLLFIVVAVVTTALLPQNDAQQFETNIQYSDMYIPASMQIIAYLTELMKYELRPPTASIPSTTTTVRPTPAHRPGLYAPVAPPARSRHFHTIAASLFRTINEPNLQPVHFDDLTLLGAGPYSLHRAINRLDDGDANDDDTQQRLDDFSEIYDDDINFHRIVLQRMKKTPPTRAYVTLLSIYDLLNKESKRLGLNKYNGFSERILADLKPTSSATSAYQLRYVLNKLVQQRETTDTALLTKIRALLDDLNAEGSYINDALRYIPALSFDY